jgi:hypothetical protein
MTPELQRAIDHAKARVDAMTPAERAAMYEAQRRSFVRAEASFGCDADEAAYRCAVAQGDGAKIARLEAEASARGDAVDAYIAEKESSDAHDG